MDRSSHDRIERSMRSQDYLPVPDGYPADLVISQDKERERFSIADADHHAFTISEKEMLEKPQKVLDRFSQEQDRNRVFRQLTLMCLLVGFPLVLYCFIFSLVAALPSLLFPARQTLAIASVICICIGVSLLAPVYQGRFPTHTSQDPISGLTSFSYATRIAALRAVCTQKQDISNLAAALKLESSPFIAERYWLAHSLAFSKSALAGELLKKLAGDPVPIVACQALWAMGNRKDREMIPQIIDHIDTTPTWYIQMYAYRALRTLGWVQPRSPLVSY